MTFIASYLSTTLPNQMSVNDLNHELAVENQLGQLQARLMAVSTGAAEGAVVSQPITLGSAGAPPFAHPDGSELTPLVAGSIGVSYSVEGAPVYQPPPGWSVGGCTGPSCATCTVLPLGSTNPSQVACGGNATFDRNFTNGSHAVTTTGGATVGINDSANNSNLWINTTGGAGLDVVVLGSHDVITFAQTGGFHGTIEIVGSYDTLNLGNTGGCVIAVYLVGNHDAISQSSKGGSTVTVNAYGSYVSVNSSTTGGATINVHYTGFNATNPFSVICPYSNLSSTDSVNGSFKGGGSFNVTFNNTNYSGNGTSGGWHEVWQKVHDLACPFVTPSIVPLANVGLASGFAVQMKNSYSPVAEVALDSGAVIYTQPGGTPVMIDGPALSYKYTTQTHNGTTFKNITQLSLWIPAFLGSVASVSGTGTAELSFQLLGTQSVVASALTGVSTNPGAAVNVTITSVYAAAWLNYLDSQPALSATCAPVGSAPASVCTGPYAPNVGQGKVVISIPETNLLSLTIVTAIFAVSVV